jgi:hypothetical protein
MYSVPVIVVNKYIDILSVVNYPPLDFDGKAEDAEGGMFTAELVSVDGIVSQARIARY